MSANIEQTILESLDKENPNILRAGCVMAGVMGLEKAERGLIKALGHQAWQVQADAARALGRLGSKGAVPFLRRLLKASDADIRQKMLVAAASRSQALEEGSEETHPKVLREAAIALNRIDPSATQEALLAALNSDQPDMLGAAMSGLANLESKQGMERMLELLEHENPSVRKAAAACLGKLGDRKAAPKLIKALKDQDAAVRKEAVIALNNLKDREAIEPLTARLGDAEVEVRRVAAIALANTRSRETSVVGALVKALQDRDAGVRAAVLKALANLKAEKALEAAATLLGDTHEDVAAQAGVTVTVLGFARERPDYDL
jgi:HEAT repeat protein